MLVLTRKVGESIIISDTIRVTVTEIRGDKVRIGIDAPSEISVNREEIQKRRDEFADREPRPDFVLERCRRSVPAQQPA